MNLKNRNEIKMEEKEEFRFISGYGTRYMISNKGNVISLDWKMSNGVIKKVVL